MWIGGVEKRKPRLAPEVGEHTEEVLRVLGFHDREVAAMLAAGVARRRLGT